MLGVLDDDPPMSILCSRVDYEPSWSYMLGQCLLCFIMRRMSFSGIISMILRAQENSRVYPKLYWPIPSSHSRILKESMQWIGLLYPVLLSYASWKEIFSIPSQYLR
jgi:hypothetical protein